MSTENTNAVADTIKQENDRPALVKKIGRTTYQVHIHFSTTSTETMSDAEKRDNADVSCKSQQKTGILKQVPVSFYSH